MESLAWFEFEVVTVNPQGKPIARERSSARSYLEVLSPGTVLEMVGVPGGRFWMGAPATEEGWQASQSPQHAVRVGSFSLGKYPVTQEQWQAVAALPEVDLPLNPNPSHFQGANRPVEQVSWQEAVEFCARLSRQAERQYRLPTEAEWEYACRAQTSTPFHFGETIATDLANYSGTDWEYQGKICSRGSYGAGPLGSDRRETTPVGSFQVANAFGLYDLHGNVREWCADPWHPDYRGAPADGSVWKVGGDDLKRVLRGGSWNVGPSRCRSAYRVKFDLEAALYDIGFRVAGPVL